MAARPQNSPRGLFSKDVINLSPESSVPTVRYGPGSMVFVGNSTAYGIAVNTTGTTWAYPVVSSLANALLLSPLAAKPTTRYGPGSLVMVANGTGRMLALNTTGTTWKYMTQTSVLA